MCTSTCLHLPRTWRADRLAKGSDDGTFVVLPRVLTGIDVAMIGGLLQQYRSIPIEDRAGSLQRRAYRIEALLLRQDARLYAKLIELIRCVDAGIWRSTERLEQVYPEFELVEYIIGEQQPAAFVNRHVDSGSVLTLVALLCDAHDFTGGASMFDERGELDDSNEERPGRKLRLEKGDAVVFRGEKLMHWIEPVTRGQRLVLQIELSRWHHPPVGF